MLEYLLRPAGQKIQSAYAYLARTIGLIAIMAVALAMNSCTGSSPKAELAYVSLERSGVVVEIDPSTGAVLREIKVGTRPRGIAVTRDGSKLLVAVSGTPIGGPNVDRSKLPPGDFRKDGVVVVDLATGRVIRRLDVGTNPETFTLSPDGSMLYVSNEDRGFLSAVSIDGSKAVQSTFVGDEPEGVAISGDGERVFVACEATDEIVLLDAQTMAIIGRTPIAGRPRTLLTSMDNETIFASLENSGEIAVLSAKDGTLISHFDVSAGSADVRPMGLAQTSRDKVFLTTGRGGSVLLINPAAARVEAQISDVGERPWGIAATKSGRLITANGPSNDVSVIDAATGQVIFRIEVGGSPWGVAIAP